MIIFKSLQSRILFFIGSLVILIILSISIVNFYTVRKTLIKDIRDKQLLSFTEASQSDIQMVIEKAMETSVLLANDPLLVKWFADGEKDNQLGVLVKARLTVTSKEMGYFTAFAVNSVTKNYWTEGNKLLDVVSESDPDDNWFFGLLKDGKKIVLNFDYNKEMDQTLFFFNALIGTAEQPLGTAGVGLKADNIIKEFNTRKLTQNSKLWLINSSGKVEISSIKEEIGKNIGTILPAGLTLQLLDKSNKKVIPDVNWDNNAYEFAKMSIGNTDFMIVVAAPTSELTLILNPIRTNTIFFGFIFFVITLGLVFLLTRSIVEPLRKITEIANEFSVGNLIPQIDEQLIKRTDEIGQLSMAFKEMKIQISRIIIQAMKSTSIVADGSQVLNSSSMQLSNRATQQSAATEEVSASMEEMSANISQNAVNAKQTESIVFKASKDAESGNAIINQTVEAIKNITVKVRIIEEIARQTNILALNAAVEAARAGDHGRGFAVVASEVRRLAERSRESAVDINQLASTSVGVAEDAGKIFTELVPVIQHSFRLVSEISAASAEQDIGASQVNKAISELDTVTQENANAAENILNLTQNFVEETQQLKEAISFFKLQE